MEERVYAVFTYYDDVVRVFKDREDAEKYRDNLTEKWGCDEDFGFYVDELTVH